jgi:hypothetical protein
VATTLGEDSGLIIERPRPIPHCSYKLRGNPDV